MSTSTMEKSGSQRLRLGGDFSRLWWSAAVSSLGDGATIAASPLLASRLTDDPRLIGAASVAFTVPFVLFGIPAGLLGDRLDIRKMMVRVDIVRAGVLAVLTVGILGGWGGLPLLYGCMFLLGVGEVLSRNAAQVLVPFITPKAGLSIANARIMAAQEAGTGFVGPLLGALMFGVVVVLPFGVDATTFLCSAVLVSRIRRTRPIEPGPGRAGVMSEMTAGARWLFSHHLLRSLALVSCLINIAGNAMLAVLVVYSGKVLHLGPFGYGVLLACQAAGAVLAARFAPALTGPLGREGALVATAVLITASETVLAAVPSVYAAGAALMIFACGTVTWNVVVVVLRQTMVPQHLLGRANSVYRLVAWGGLPVGAAAGGFVAAEAGTRAVFGAGAVVMAVVAVALFVGARRQWITRAEQGAEQAPTPTYETN
ncbi:MFS transporter [Kitasatospora sp. RB6PN24]|uniref:MFS transporter n=1 Tax=Kitasatospora humi TaxID=2893891 RepID=UPI001E55B999|nr:MFS transporter [Kitasatospora humi]MCC9310560.1 MFS transporter [Kitasatospora humi]